MSQKGWYLYAYLVTFTDDDLTYILDTCSFWVSKTWRFDTVKHVFITQTKHWHAWTYNLVPLWIILISTRPKAMLMRSLYGQKREKYWCRNDK